MMTMAKYTIKLNDLEKQGGVERLVRDGFKREDISKALYRETDGARDETRQKIMSQLHDKK